MGADGFIGSHLTESSLEKGYEVKAFAMYNSFSIWGWLDTFSKEKLNRIEILSGDIRDPNGVKQALNGFIAIAESDKTIGEEINIATQQEISIGDLASEIIVQINRGAKIVCDEQRLRPEKSKVNRLLGCNEKIKRLTDWKTSYTLAEGLKETIRFIEDNLDKYKPNIYNM